MDTASHLQRSLLCLHRDAFTDGGSSEALTGDERVRHQHFGLCLWRILAEMVANRLMFAAPDSCRSTLVFLPSRRPADYRQAF